MKVVIVAGGKGTRIASVNSEIPKSLIPVCGKPVIVRQVELARQHGLTEFTIVIGHLGQRIRDCLGDGSSLGVKISYFDEPFPMGTAGALALLKKDLLQDFFVFYGDTIMDVALDAMAAYHARKGADLTLLVHPNSHPYDSDLVEVGERDEVTRFFYKPHPAGFEARNLVNGALYVVSPGLLNLIPENRKVSFEKDFMKTCLEKGRRLYGYHTTEYIKDMGTPDRYASIQKDIENGLPRAMNRCNRRPAVFLDRDGVVNREVNLLGNKDDVALIDGAPEAVSLINKSGFLAVIVTNQPVIARNLCSIEELREIHNRIETELGKGGAFLDGIFYCPHHPDAGFPEERKEYKIICDCRKPKPGLILKAAKDLNIDLARSYMIGDRETDVLSGKNAGLRRSILIPANENGALLKAVREILDNDHI